jgi:hypothetical protein
MNGKPISASLIHGRVSLMEWHEGFINPGFEHPEYHPFLSLFERKGTVYDQTGVLCALHPICEILL